jgi:Protein of unknown function (DUF742)
MSSGATPDRPDEPPQMRIVRPYALTGGRTRSGASDLPIETLVRTSDRGREVGPKLQLEYRTIAELCEEPLSVAEVSAHLGVPLGVARVLVTDMSEQGLVDVHKGRTDRPNQALLERVLHGIRDI